MATPRAGCEVVTLPGGARAIKDCASGQVMHCGTGPSVEPDAIYVGPSRLDVRLGEVGASLVLFDVGLGAASNALAAWRVSEAAPLSARRLELVSFDHEVLALELALLPENLASFGLSDPAAYTAVRALLKDGTHETERTTWRLALGDFPRSLALEPVGAADIVFWDLYSARTNPHLWTVSLFQGLRRACRDGATLHTTNTSTSARTSMLLGGFAVGVSAGTGSRGETTIASTHHHDLQLPLGARWLERLGRSSAAFSSEVVDGVGALATVRGLPQFR
jgi:queuine tRNA-ribosyltransferase